MTGVRKVVLAGCFFLMLAGRSLAGGVVTLADYDYEGVQIHNRIVGFIIEHGMGYTPEYTPGGSPMMFQGVVNGSIDVSMAVWISLLGDDLYLKNVEAGRILDLGTNYEDAVQGWYVPTYLVKGDPDRGIEAAAPGLAHVADLPKYWRLFRDPEDPGKGRLFTGVAGWFATITSEKKLAAYGLEETYNGFVAGSDTLLTASMTAAYERGKPWLGYYFKPTWIMGKLDMTRLGEPPYDPVVWEESRACASPEVDVHILANRKLCRKAPDVCEFLKRYETDIALNNRMLLRVEEQDASPEEVALWFLETREKIWGDWVTPEVRERVKRALKG